MSKSLRRGSDFAASSESSRSKGHSSDHADSGSQLEFMSGAPENLMSGAHIGIHAAAVDEFASGKHDGSPGTSSTRRLEPYCRVIDSVNAHLAPRSHREKDVTTQTIVPAQEHVFDPKTNYLVRHGITDTTVPVRSANGVK